MRSIALRFRTCAPLYGLCAVALCMAVAPGLSAQALPPAPDAPDTLRPSIPPPDTLHGWRKSEFRIPLASIAVPGLGQYVHREYLTGFAYTATAGAGYLAARGNTAAAELGDFPRDGGDQFAYEALHVGLTAGFLSAWDAFHRAVPALQGEKKYEFLTGRENVGDLLSAPFETEFLGRWTTWVELAYTGLVAGLLLGGRDGGIEYEPFRSHDALFVTSLSLNAGVGEEAAFRGWLLPLFYQRFGRRFGWANAAQATLFGLLHPQAGAFATVIAGWAFYEGWLTRRNDWSIRESIFHHFWYDVAVGVASFLDDEREGRIQLTFPTIRF